MPKHKARSEKQGRATRATTHPMSRKLQGRQNFAGQVAPLLAVIPLLPALVGVAELTGVAMLYGLSLWITCAAVLSVAIALLVMRPLARFGRSVLSTGALACGLYGLYAWSWPRPTWHVPVVEPWLLWEGADLDTWAALIAWASGPILLIVDACQLNRARRTQRAGETQPQGTPAQGDEGAVSMPPNADRLNALTRRANWLTLGPPAVAVVFTTIAFTTAAPLRYWLLLPVPLPFLYAGFRIIALRREADLPATAWTKVSMVSPVVMLLATYTSVALQHDGLDDASPQIWTPHGRHAGIELLHFASFVLMIVAPLIDGALFRHVVDGHQDNARSANDLPLRRWCQECLREIIGVQPGMMHGDVTLTCRACGRREKQNHASNERERRRAELALTVGPYLAAIPPAMCVGALLAVPSTIAVLGDDLGNPRAMVYLILSFASLIGVGISFGLVLLRWWANLPMTAWPVLALVFGSGAAFLSAVSFLSIALSGLSFGSSDGPPPPEIFWWGWLTILCLGAAANALLLAFESRSLFRLARQLRTP
ncbi:MAG: hypothetical protein AAF288_07380 [Planctomycetota bacterium]